MLQATGRSLRTGTRGVLFALIMACFVAPAGAGPVCDSSSQDYQGEQRVQPTRNDIYLVQYSYEDQKQFGWKPRNELEPWPFKLPLDWAADPFKDSDWRFQLHAWRILEAPLNAYFDNGDKKALREAADIALDWGYYHARNPETPYSWHDHATALRALKLAFFLSRVESGELVLSDKELGVLCGMAEEHEKRLQDEAFIGINNHGLFQVFGLNLLCTVDRRPPCANGLAFAKRMFDKILAAQYTPEGVHAEHSPYYHNFVTTTIEQLGGAEKFHSESASRIVAAAKRVTPWLVFPDGQFARVGDSFGRIKIDPPADGKRECTERCFSIGDFTHSGYAIVRSVPEVPPESASMLFVTGMSWDEYHRHADQLSFELFEFGRFVLIDSGAYGYEYDDMYEYVLSAAAHNTVSLLHQKIPPDSIAGSGSFLSPIDRLGNGFLIAGKIERPGMFAQSRTIFYEPGRWLRIEDRLEAETSEAFVSSLHLAPDLIPEVTKDGFSVAINDHTKMIGHIIGSKCFLEAVRGQKSPPLGWATKDYLKMEPTTVVRALCPSDDKSITWNIEFSVE